MNESTSPVIPTLSKINKQELPETFATWVGAQDVGEAGAWLLGLNADNKKAITNEIAGFCEDAGFNLAWVIESQIDNEPLSSNLKHVVIHYLNAGYKAAIVQQGLTLHKEIVKWLSNPMARKNWMLTREVYIQLVNRGIVENASAEILLDSNRNRWEHVETSVRKAYQKDPQTVRELVQSSLMTKQGSTLSLPEGGWWPLKRRQEPAALAAPAAENLVPA